MEDPLNGVPKSNRVWRLMLPDEEKIDEISGARGAAALVRPRVGVQLLGDLPLQWHQQNIYRVESEFGQESRAPCGLSIPGIRCGDTDVHLQWLEQSSSEGALQLVSHGQTDTRVTEFLGACQNEAEVVADLFDAGTLQI
jgi:hypothetical protein